MKNLFTLSGWMKWKRLESFFTSPEIKKKTRSFQAALLAIIFGFVLAIIFVFINGYNGFGFLSTLFSSALDNTKFGGTVPSAFDKTMQYFSVYMLMGLGIAIGFKLGIFNMGGSGQAVLGLGLSIYVLNNYAKKHDIAIADIPSSYAINVVLLYIVAGIAISSIAGILKAFLNIHEVVTTVMLNWTVWYLVRWLDKKIIDASGTGTIVTQNTSWFDLGGSHYALGLIIALISIFTMWVVLNFTTFGYKFKIVGTQASAAKYAGIKASFYIILTTALQGLFIGIGGVFFYQQTEVTLSFQTDLVPTIGFDAIAIPLIAFNNLLGIIPVAFLWAIIKEGSILITGDLNFIGFSPYMGSLAFGLIVYGSAIYIIFTKFQPINQTMALTIYLKSWATRAKVYGAKREIKLVKIEKQFLKYDNELLILENKLKEAKKSYQECKDKTKKTYLSMDLKTAEQNYRFEKKSQVEMIKNTIKTMKNDIKQMKKECFDNYFEFGVPSIRRNYVYNKKEELYGTFDEVTIIISDCLVKIESLKTKFKKENSDLKLKVKSAKKDFIKSKNSEDEKKWNQLVETQKNLMNQKNENIKNLKQQATNDGFGLIDKYYRNVKDLTENYKKNKVNAKKDINLLKESNKNELLSAIKTDWSDKKVADKKVRELITNLKTEVKSSTNDNEKIKLYQNFAVDYEKTAYEWEKSRTVKLWIKRNNLIRTVVTKYGRS